jgi:uncharacterized membrane protein YhaH (DUF805 family)
VIETYMLHNVDFAIVRPAFVTVFFLASIHIAGQVPRPFGNLALISNFRTENLLFLSKPTGQNYIQLARRLLDRGDNEIAILYFGIPDLISVIFQLMISPAMIAQVVAPFGWIGLAIIVEFVLPGRGGANSYVSGFIESESAV